jgi:hypothetical protein
MAESAPDNLIKFPKPSRHVELPTTSRVPSPELFSQCLVIHMSNHTKEAINAPFGRMPRLPWWPIACALGIGAGAAAVIFSIL